MSAEQLVIDRFEGEYAVCETQNRDQQLLERSRLPAEAKEGDCLIISEDGAVTIDVEETARKREAVNKLLQSLLKR